MTILAKKILTKAEENLNVLIAKLMRRKEKTIPKPKQILKTLLNNILVSLPQMCRNKLQTLT